MTRRALRTISRISFLLCGLISLLTCAPYALLRGVDLPVQSEWVIFVSVLALVGVLSVVMAVLPRSWIATICRRDRDDERLFSVPLKMLGSFAAIFYVVAVVAYLVPQRWQINPQIALSLCPMYLVRMMFDPSLAEITLLLAPMNAAVYGSVGLTLGCTWLAFRGRGSGQIS